MFFILFSTISLSSLILFHYDIYFSLSSSVLIFIFVSIYLLYSFRQNKIGLLTLWLYACYSLPFIHMIPQIFFDYSKTHIPHHDVLWGLSSNPYMFDKDIIELTGMIGAIGACGFVMGIVVGSFNKKKYEYTYTIFAGKKLSLHSFLSWIIIAILASYLFAPEDLLTQRSYGESMSISGDWNFNSLWHISYIILIFLMGDTLRYRTIMYNKLKRLFFVLSITYVVIWLQLLRGDRESITLIISLVFMYILMQNNTVKASRIPILKLALFFLFLFFTIFIIGYIRFNILGSSFTEIIDKVFFGLHDALTTSDEDAAFILNGTWSSVLLGPLSIAGDYIYGTLPLRMGTTYYDLIASIIPGFIADAIGYVRPLDVNNPVGDIRYGQGGWHATVVPFTNFRLFGVYFVTFLWSLFFTIVERQCMKKLNIFTITFLGTIIMTAPHWLWYGEKYIINGIIVWFILSICYKLSVSKFTINF